MNKFNEFRTTVLSCVRKGVTQEQYKTLKDGKPEFEAIMDKCSKYGILKTGRITKQMPVKQIFVKNQPL